MKQKFARSEMMSSYQFGDFGRRRAQRWRGGM